MAAVQPAIPPSLLDPPATPVEIVDVPAADTTLDQAPLLNILKSDDDDFERLRPPGSIKAGDADPATQLTPQQLAFLRQMQGLISEVQQKETDRMQAQQAARTQEMEEALMNLNKDMQKPIPESKSLKPKVDSWLTGVHPDFAPHLDSVPEPGNQDVQESPRDVAQEQKRLMELAYMLKEIDLLEMTRLRYTNAQRETIEGIHDAHRAAVYQVAEDEELDVASLKALEQSFQTRRTDSIVAPRRDPADTDPSVESVAGSGMGSWLGLGKGSMYNEIMTDQDVSIWEANDGEVLQSHVQVPITQYLTDDQRWIRKALAKVHGEDAVAKYSRAFRRVQIFPKIVKMAVSLPPSTLDGITVGPSVTVPATILAISLATREAPSSTMETAAAAGAPLVELDPANAGLGIEAMSDDAVLDGPGFDSAEDDGRSVTGSGFGPVEDDVGSVISGLSDQGDAGMPPGNSD
jgi:hypothetical protein